MRKFFLWLMVVLSAVLLSLPWLVPHCGAFALVAFLPLLCADAFASELRMKHFWLYAFTAFVLWNAATTFWVCNATVGGGIAAIIVNSLIVTLVWQLFRFSKDHLHGVLPYVFLAAMWIAWERVYFSLDISWPWLTLGNAFARSTRMVQWYEYTGTLGGSLWVWASNLAIFGIIVATSDNYWMRWRIKGSLCALLGVTLIVAGPLVASRIIYECYEEKSEGRIEVLIGQPDFDPYEKFQSLTQDEQTATLLNLFESAGDQPDGMLYMGPETFTSDILLDRIEDSPTVKSVRSFLAGRGAGSKMLFGATTYDVYTTRSAPSILARPYGDGWIESHNSAIMLDADAGCDVFHKSKLVVGTELTPYPKLFVPLDNWLSSLFGVSGLMGRCVGQPQISLMNYSDDVALGCAVCYESVYGEYCTGYVRKGAKAMTVITNDAWWGDTPGYKQHMSYSRLRAIELRRDFARCANTGISCFIDQRGDVVSQTDWWVPATLRGHVNLNSEETVFVRYGDIVGRVCTLVFLMLILLYLVNLILRR